MKAAGRGVAVAVGGCGIGVSLGVSEMRITTPGVLVTVGESVMVGGNVIVAVGDSVGLSVAVLVAVVVNVGSSLKVGSGSSCEDWHATNDRMITNIDRITAGGFAPLIGPSLNSMASCRAVRQQISGHVKSLDVP